MRSSITSVKSRAARGGTISSVNLSKRSANIRRAPDSAAADSVRIPGFRHLLHATADALGEKYAESLASNVRPHRAQRSNGGSHPPSFTVHSEKYASGSSDRLVRLIICAVSSSNRKFASDASWSGKTVSVTSLRIASATPEL